MGNIKKTSSTGFGALERSGALILFGLLSGCALFPPPPTQCNGQFKPVNVPVDKVDASNMPAVDSNAGSKSSELDKPLQSDEGAINGK